MFWRNYSRWKVLCGSGILAVTTYLACSPLLLGQWLLFQAKRVDCYRGIPSVVLGAPSRPVEFNSPAGNKICGYLFSKPGAHWTILIHHGQGGNLETHLGLARTALLAGCSAFIYDYEGFGASEGVASTGAMMQDGEAAFKFLTEKLEVPAKNIFQMGVSLGTGAACYVAGRHHCGGVILVSPYTSLRRVALDAAPWIRLYPSFFFPFPDPGCTEFVRTNSDTPVLFIHGAKDFLISPSNSTELASKSPAPHRLKLYSDVHHGDFSTTDLADDIRLFIVSLDLPATATARPGSI